MKPYESYTICKPLWNQAFPSHWGILPMYAIAREKSICNCVDLPLLSVYLDVGVIPFSAKAEKRTNVTSKDLSKYQRVDCGDFVLNNQQAWRGSVGIAFNTGIVSPAYIVLSMNDSLDSKYANYLFRSRVMVDQYLVNSKGVGSIQRNIYWPALKRAIVPVPPRPEQDQIVRFLDWKVSSINKIINIKRKEIIELKSLKRSVVNHAVTHGLNPDVVMKNSGVNWLGEIPAHWEVLALKRMCSMKSGDNLTNLEIIDNGEYKVYGGNGIRGFFHRFNCENECVLIGRQGALCGNVHFVTERIWATDHAVITKAFRNISTKYLYYLLMAMNLNQYGQSTAAQPGISVGVVKNLQACLPSRIEQDQIVTYLESTDENYDKVAQIIDAEITALLELKARLISDTVTGKIDVRDIKIPEYEFADEEPEIEESSEETKVQEEFFDE